MVTISTYSSGGGLILYQAYGNLYAMPRFGGKWTRESTGMKIDEELHSECGDAVTIMCDAVRIQEATPSEAFETTSGSAVSLKTQRNPRIATPSENLRRCSKPINRGLIQSIPTSLPPQPIGEATKASNLRRKPSGVQGRSHFTYLFYERLSTLSAGLVM
ncbi:hypothetical protein Tco_1333007 [Tanacetum coccineum]